MYDRDDVTLLTDRFMECIEARRNKKENIFHSTSTLAKMQNRKLSRDEEIRMRSEKSSEVRLMYNEFLKIVLDF